MKKINVLVTAVVLTNRVYASGFDSFFGHTPLLRMVPQNHQNYNTTQATSTSSSNNINGANSRIQPNNVVSINCGGIRLIVQHIPEHSNRVEYTEYLDGNIVLLRFILNPELNGIIEDFPRSLVRTEHFGTLTNVRTNVSSRGGSVNIFRIDQDLGSDLITDIMNFAAISNGRSNGYYPRAIIINNISQLRRRISLFIDRDNPRRPIAEFLLRRDVEATEDSIRGLTILTRLLSNFGRNDVNERLRYSNFLDYNRFNVLENTNLETLEQNLISTPQFRSIFPEDNPVTGTSIHVSAENTVTMRVVGNNFRRNDYIILNNFLDFRELNDFLDYSQLSNVLFDKEESDEE